MKKNGSPLLWFGIIILLMGIVLQGCSDRVPDDSSRVLVKVGDRTVTVHQYKQIFEMAVVSYPLQVLKDRQYVEGLKLMLLNQIIDELAILSRADELELSISDEELKNEVARIKADYPDDTFDKMLLEQSIPLRKWKESLEKRLLIEKVVENELDGAEGSIFKRTPAVFESDDKIKDTTEPIREDTESKIEEQEVEEKQIKELAEESDLPKVNTSEMTLPQETESEPQTNAAVKPKDPYSVWITELRDKYPIRIDEVLWERIKKE